jgi:hypothetical protein
VTYNLYLYREALALEVPKHDVVVLGEGRSIAYDGWVYGVNGVHHHNGILMIGLFGPYGPYELPAGKS